MYIWKLNLRDQSIFVNIVRIMNSVLKGLKQLSQCGYMTNIPVKISLIVVEFDLIDTIYFP